MFMRFELAQPGIATNKEIYNTIMSTHGAMMVTVALVSIIGGLGNYLVPIMIGARDMAFPKANALSYWMLPLPVLFVIVNPLLGGFDSGWTAYPPLSQQANLGQQAYIMAFVTVGRQLDPQRDQLPRHRLPHARPGHVAHADADLRLGAHRDRRLALDRHLGRGGGVHDAPLRPRARDVVLPRRAAAAT